MPGRVERRGIARPSGTTCGSAQASAKLWRRGSKKSAEDPGNRPGRRRHQPALYPGAREGRSPLGSSIRKSPIGPVPAEPPDGATKKKQPQERQHSAAVRRDAGPTAIPRPVKKAPAGGSASRRRGTRRDPGPSASGEGYVIAREGSKPHGRDAARLGSREPGAALAARASKEFQLAN